MFPFKIYKKRKGKKKTTAPDPSVKLISFNCKNVTRSVDCIRRLCVSADIIALQETWLLPHEISLLGQINDNFVFTGVSAVDTSDGVLRGRPYGGVALLWKKASFASVSVIKCNSARLVAIKVMLHQRSILVFSIYMPTDSIVNLPEFTDCLSEVNAIIETNNVESVFMLWDFNAHPGELFNTELIRYCVDQKWKCVDLELLPPDTYTYVSDSCLSRRWLDHCVVTEAARSAVSGAAVVYDSY